MKRLILITVVILLCGCSPQRRLARLLDKYPLPADTTSIDTVTRYIPDTISVVIPGETVRDTVYVPEYRDLPDTSLKTATTFAEAFAGITGGVLWLDLIQKDTVVPVRVDSILVERLVETVITKTVVKPGPSSFWKHGFLVLAGLILILAALWFLLRKK